MASSRPVVCFHQFFAIEKRCVEREMIFWSLRCVEGPGGIHMKDHMSALQMRIILVHTRDSPPSKRGPQIDCAMM